MADIAPENMGTASRIPTGSPDPGTVRTYPWERVINPSAAPNVWRLAEEIVKASKDGPYTYRLGRVLSWQKVSGITTVNAYTDGIADGLTSKIRILSPYIPTVDDMILILVMPGGSMICLGSLIGRTDTARFQNVIALSGPAYDPTIHRAVVWSDTIVFGTGGGPNFAVNIPTTNVGYTGAWGINGDTAANAIRVEGITGYNNFGFLLHCNVATGAPVRFNFGCTYWELL